jgi:hypothetical protein
LVCPGIDDDVFVRTTLYDTYKKAPHVQMVTDSRDYFLFYTAICHACTQCSRTYRDLLEQNTDIPSWNKLWRVGEGKAHY